MQRHKRMEMKAKTFLMPLAAMAFMMSCSQVTYETKNVLGQFREDPVTINWYGSKDEGLQSFSANVHVFSMNNRTDTHASLTSAYRMSVSSINHRILTRIDMDLDESIPFRSIVSDGEEAIAFNPATNEIGYRIPMDDSDLALRRIFGMETTMSRVNLSFIREEAMRLSLNISEDSVANIMVLHLPPGLLAQNDEMRIISSRVAFDMANETLLETELVMVREDETVVTSTAIPVYEDYDGVPIKIGMVTVIDSRAPGLIEDIDPDFPIFESPDDIPTISEAELAALRESGIVQDIPNMTFGDPADLSYVVTVFEVYQDIEINAVPESAFRLILK